MNGRLFQRKKTVTKTIFEPLMRKKILIPVLILVAIAATAAVSVVIFSKENNRQRHAHDRLSKQELAMLRPGDIILRQGFGMVSDMISNTLDEDYKISHCGIVALDSIGKLRVIHSVSSSLSDWDGVQDVNMKGFFRESKQNSLIVVRFRDTGDIPLAQLAGTAQSYLDRRIPFDEKFDITEQETMYCSEMIWSAILETYGFDIYPDKTSAVATKFTPFFDTTHFAVIINHNTDVKNSPSTHESPSNR